jgi:hypothetical protein
MQVQDFIATLSNKTAPSGLSILLQSLWLDGKGNWKAAHELVNEMEDRDACWVHAYLHRKEGDLSNAHYWYRRAGKKMPDHPLQKEWEEIVETLLNTK